MEHGLQSAGKGPAWVELLVGLGLMLVLPAGAQSDRAGPSAPRKSAAHSIPRRAVMDVSGDVFCEINDPNTGERWLLLRDSSHRGGPGRLVLSAHFENGEGGKAGNHFLSEADIPVIHAGDPLIVEEHTAVVDARLEAVALGTAAKGGVITVRLKIGGRMVRVVALGRGRAELAPENEADR